MHSAITFFLTLLITCNALIAQSNTVLELTIDGAIHPPCVDYIPKTKTTWRGIETASELDNAINHLQCSDCTVKYCAGAYHRWCHSSSMCRLY
jgi:hypothetical protein